MNKIIITGIIIAVTIIIGVVSVLSQSNNSISMDIGESQKFDNPKDIDIEAEADEESPSPIGKQISVELEETMGLTSP